MPTFLRHRPRTLAAVVATAVLAAGCGADEKTADPARAPGNPTERAFLSAMVPHHQAAIDMSEVAARRAEAADLKRIAAGIAAAQRREIEQMRGIHQRLFGRPLVPDAAAHERLGLSAEEAGMDHGGAAASLARAKPFDRAFVDEMVPHHEGAVRMAKGVLARTRDTELRRLAETIVATQEREIRQMNAFRVKAYGAPATGRPGHGKGGPQDRDRGGDGRGGGGGGAPGGGGPHGGGHTDGEGTTDGVGGGVD